mgnify:CR=1 FL=1
MEPMSKGSLFLIYLMNHRDLVLPNLRDIALLTLVSLTSPIERIKKLTADAEGFIYAVTVNGITGTGQDFRNDLMTHLSRIKSFSKIPVLAGFGISTNEHIKKLSAGLRWSCYRF